MSKACSGVTALTLFDLVKKSMRKNLKHYYLYFFALIFSVMLYFVFATLQQDGAIIQQAGESKTFSSAFKVAGVLLIGISGIFIIYANTLFLNRRSREIGLYQLIGLTKNAVARMLIIENILLSAGALIVGIGTGLVVSRLFLMLLVKLIGQSGIISLSISGTAIVQTFLVFAVITIITSIQMLLKVKRKTLIQLFNEEKTGEHPRKPKRFLSPLLAILGIALIVFGYWLSGNLFKGVFLVNAVVVLFSTIFGAYLIFRISISWLFYQVRQRKNGLLGLSNSLSIAPLMHRMKGNAKSLTIITVLSAMTLATIAGAYALYYSTEREARHAMPQDFLFINEKADAEQFVHLLADHQIDATLTALQYLQTSGTYENFNYTGFIEDSREGEHHFKVYNGAQLQEANFDLQQIKDGEAVYFDPIDLAASQFVKDPFQIRLEHVEHPLQVNTVGKGNVVNVIDFDNSQLVVNDATFQRLQADDQQTIGAFYAVTITDEEQLEKASTLFQTLPEGINDTEQYALTYSDYYSLYTGMLEENGLLIFIAGFLGLVFLISTGSILYFKQMTEAEQERKSYATLRQLGFSIQDIMKGIIRKQLFVFGLPLFIGILHSIFAIRSVDLLFTENIVVPTAIAMSAYALIYFVFALLTVGYYRKIVKTAL